jgi:hypothetical protein
MERNTKQPSQWPQFPPMKTEAHQSGLPRSKEHQNKKENLSDQDT